MALTGLARDSPRESEVAESSTACNRLVGRREGQHVGGAPLWAAGPCAGAASCLQLCESGCWGPAGSQPAQRLMPAQQRQVCSCCVGHLQVSAVFEPDVTSEPILTCTGLGSSDLQRPSTQCRLPAAPLEILWTREHQAVAPLQRSLSQEVKKWRKSEYAGTVPEIQQSGRALASLAPY